MKRLYIGSLKSPSGKTTLSLGLCLILKKIGIDLGFIKPLGTTPVSKKGKILDETSVLFKDLLGLDADLEMICPYVRGYDSMYREITLRKGTIKRKVLSSVQAQSDKELVVLSGAASLTEGALLDIDMKELLDTTDSSLLLVEQWKREESVDTICFAKDFFREALLGVVINMVRQEEMKEVQSKVVPFFKKRGIRIFGILPFNPTLAAPTVAQLSKILGGKVLCCEDAMQELVEHYLVGAMDVNEAIKYFKKTPNKAVITGAHRSDIQLAALETSTKCIILTGGLEPNDVIIGKAKLKGVPVISVRYDTFTVVDKIEGFYGRAGITHPKKVEIIEKLTDELIDVKGILKGIGLRA